MKMNRFDNISTAMLIEAEQAARRELKLMANEVKRRLIAESGIIVGRKYRVADDGRPCAKRLIWVEGLNVGYRDTLNMESPYCFAWGRMNGKSAAGDGWTIKRQNIDITRLTLVDVS